MMDDVLRNDKPLQDLLEKERTRQCDTLEMIASESMQSDELLYIAGSVFNNKTAVGLPGHQRLMGSSVADALERLTVERACRVFGAEHANVNPYSGSVANYCAYAACMRPGDCVVALDSAAGSHQTHGGNNNISADIYDFHYFGLHPDTYLIDYEEAERMIAALSPKLLVIGSSAYSRTIDYERLAKAIHAVGGKLLVDLAHFTGLVAAGVSNDPVPYADIVTVSGTKTMCGPHTGMLLCKKEMAEVIDRQVYPGYVSSLHLQTIAAMAYAIGQTQTEAFRALMRQVVKNAQALCRALIARGFGILTGGTDCHMFIADVRPFGIDAVRFVDQMEAVGISVNTKGIPYDPSPTPNGVRAGTIVLTQRGMCESDMEYIADIWQRVATATREEELSALRAEVYALTRRFPLSGACHKTEDAK